MTTFAFDINDSTIHFLADQAAQDAFDKDHDGYIIAQWSDLYDMTGFQLVTLYNGLQHAIARLTPGSGPVSEVKRFATKGAAEDRIKPLVGQLHELVREQAKTAKPKSKPKKASTGRRGTGVNLAPKAVVYPCRAGTKQAILVNLLSREQGATMTELLDALSGGKKPWLEVTVKSGLNWDMNKIKGYGIRTEAVTMDAAFKDCRFEDLGTLGAAMDALKLPDQHPDSLDIREHRDALIEAGWDTSETVDVYHLTYPEGMDAPLPHTIKKG